jgi:hypothetical protein
MENTQLDGEVRFSEAFRIFKQNILSYLYTSDKLDFSKENSKTSTLEVRSYDLLIILDRYINVVYMFAEYKISYSRRYTIF